MLALAGHPLGHRLRYWIPPRTRRRRRCARWSGDYDDLERSPSSPTASTSLTYEFENVPVEAARFVEALLPVFPPPASLEAARIASPRSVVRRVGLEVPPSAPVDSLEASRSALARASACPRC